ncbi:MAG: TetR/AcrR family transcriptional regulator [Lachnospiraceae bacterium]|nr:TetR/AcrR family transcriptional regulator [Lachnospiraceae bacterium]
MYEELNEYIKEMQNLPEKEIKIYLAVGELIKEGRDINDMKVSEISQRAGIGKGTTYEYFQSKEELIYKAIHYFVIDSTKVAILKIMGEGSFKEKFYSIMDYIWESRLEERTLQSMLQFARSVRSSIDTSSFNQIGDKYDPCTAVKFIEELLKQYLTSGYEEGIFTETDDIYRKDVLCSQVLLFLFLMQDVREEERKKEIEDFVYNGMIMLLNAREKGKKQ